MWNTGLVAKPTANNVVYDSVLKNVGAWPGNRDSVDTRIINTVKNRNGQIINCVSADGSARCAKNAGGWPSLPQNTRALTIPADSNGVSASGYTNLEVWLQGYAAQVEGRAVVSPPKAPTNLTISVIRAQSREQSRRQDAARFRLRSPPQRRSVSASA